MGLSKRTRRILKRIGLAFLLVLVALCVSFYFLVKLDIPELTAAEQTSEGVRVIEKDGLRRIDNSWYRKSENGLWEMYLEGAAYERGVVYGKLAEKEIRQQEDVFVAQIKKLIPSSFWRGFLRFFVAWFNKDLDEHIPFEYQKEILGISHSFSNDHDFIGPKYYRILNYHAAHDIGHALTDLSLVGCTSFATWNEFSADSNLLVARNFDFYMGDDFARNKLLSFVKPDSGYAYCSISWAGFTGVVSGMNEKGLCITLNAAKSDLPLGAKTPISLLAREILQYASTIDQAYAIAQTRETFVSESLLIGSALDGRAALIEKSTGQTALYDPSKGHLTCSNHYQGSAFRNDSANLQNIAESDSRYRFERAEELMELAYPLNPEKAIAILRNQKGKGDTELGMGNPKAINQLLAHHGILFQPEEKKIWITAGPFQMGSYVCYQLDSVFKNAPEVPVSGKRLYENNTGIPADTFLSQPQYEDFLHFKKVKQHIFDFCFVGIPYEMTEQGIDSFVRSNPDSYLTYELLGDYYAEKKNPAAAAQAYGEALKREVASLAERRKIEQKKKENEETRK